MSINKKLIIHHKRGSSGSSGGNLSKQSILQSQQCYRTFEDSIGDNLGLFSHTLETSESQETNPFPQASR